MSRAAATPATAALGRAGVGFRTHLYAFAPAADGIGRQAARALAVPPERLLKTLVVDLGDAGLALAILGVDRSLDLKAVARALGGKRATLAPLAAAERATGYVKGGISPFGLRRPLPAVVDRAALGAATVLVNGGRRGVQLELAPADLVDTLGAVVADLGVPPRSNTDN